MIGLTRAIKKNYVDTSLISVEIVPRRDCSVLPDLPKKIRSRSGTPFGEPPLVWLVEPYLQKTCKTVMWSNSVAIATVQALAVVMIRVADRGHG